MDGRFMFSEGWAPGSVPVASLSSQRIYPSLRLRWRLAKQSSGTHRHTTRRVTTLVVINSDTTAVLPKIPHSNCCKRVSNRPLRPRRGRFETLLQQLECGIFGRTAVNTLVAYALLSTAPSRLHTRWQKLRSAQLQHKHHGKGSRVAVSAAHEMRGAVVTSTHQQRLQELHDRC